MIPLFKVNIPHGYEASLLKTMNSGFIGEGPMVAKFEKNLGNYIGNCNVLSVNSGTSGLHLALRLCDVGIGDEVISTPMTCTATNMPILERGAKIVWSDIDPKTGSIDPESILKKITTKTKAIVVVHWGGNVVNLERIKKIASKNNIKIIEDAAHAFGSTYQNQKIGNHSDFIVFSFQAIKHLTTIDGGAVFCKSHEDFQRGKRLRWFGIDRDQPRKDFRCEEDIIEHGYKFHMNDVSATIGIEQLKHIDKIINIHNNNWKYYIENINESDELHTIPINNESTTSAWLFTIHVKDRDKFISEMTKNKIMVSRVHERNDNHTCFKEFKVRLPGVEAFNKTQISIPVGWWVTKEQREYISSCINKFSGA